MVSIKITAAEQCSMYVHITRNATHMCAFIQEQIFRWEQWRTESFVSFRNEAHKHFSKLIRDDYMTKQEAYQWLAGLLGAPQREAHIGYLSEYYCNIVIEESKKEYERYLRKKRERKNFERSALAS